MYCVVGVINILILPDKARFSFKEEERKKEEKRMAPADKNTAFQEFKSGPGSELNQKLNENKEILKDKKKYLKNAGSLVNNVKKEIDSLKVSHIV